MFECSPVYYANYQSEADIVINQGGTDSGKTYAIMQLLFTYCINTIPPKIDPVITIVGESIPNLKAGAYRIGQSIYQNTTEIFDAVQSWNKSDMTFHFKNGWLMEFKSYETEQQAKQGKRQFAFFNEANGIPYMIFWQVAKRSRKRVFIDYNPSAPFWAHEKLIGTTPDSNDLAAEVQLIISDHRHNPFLSEKEHARTEGIKDKDLWWVYARGRTGQLRGIIYTGWTPIPDTLFPNEDGVFWGIDFGYENDPTALVKCVKVAQNIYLHEIAYETGSIPCKTIAELLKVNGYLEDQPLYCEHDPDMIRQLREFEIRSIAARKGQGSIKAGISKIKEYKIFYTESSSNIRTEVSKYMWDVDKVTNQPTNVPKEGFDHIMDAIRYAIYTNFYRQE